MSVCLETSTGLASQVSTSTTSRLSEDGVPAEQADAPPAPVRTLTKLPVAAPAGTLPKASLITVLNNPLSVKTLCVTPAVPSNVSGQFTVVNSATPINVANAAVKPQTITLINTPVTVVKTISPSVEKSAAEIVPNNAAAVPVESRGHNVFVKNTSNVGENAALEVPQGHKLLTANNFPANNVINVADVNAQKTANGQRSKVKILSNVLMPGTSQGIIGGHALLNKLPNPAQRFTPRQKLLGANNGATKYLNRPPMPHNMKNVNMISKQPPPSQRIIYPTHKSQIKTLPPVNNYMHAKPPGIKTLPPKAIPGQVQRTGSGLRTIPPQRPPKMANKPNYIGKHAVQAQKMKHPHKLKNIKTNQMYNSYHSPLGQDKQQMTFNQALTAEILETLSSNKPNTNNVYPNKGYENLSPRYDSSFYTSEMKCFLNDQSSKGMVEERAKSGLDALSLICQAVLLDHNYNATLPESPTRSTNTVPNTPQMNGISSGSSMMYSPGSNKRRTLSASNPVSSSTSLSTLSAVPSNSNLLMQDDDAQSDISDVSDRKHDTEGEETDTAPEAEAVNNEDPFGDYVTRCICGFIHDDGYMIECDHCKVWQHVQCVVKNKQVPEEYLCEVCDPRKHIDRQKARAAQQQWLRDRQFIDPKLRKDPKLKEVFKHKEIPPSDSDSSDGEHTGHNNNVVGKGRPALVRRKSDQKGGPRQRRDSGKEVVQKRQIRKRDRKVGKRKTKGQLKNHSDDENHDAVVAASSTATHLPQLRQWIENYEEAVTNHYSPELRARISNIRVNGAHTDLSIDFDQSVHKCRVYTQPLTELRYLVSTVHLPPNSPVIELRGKYMLSAQHRNSGSNFNTRQHSQRPGPFLFFYRLHKDNTEVCVDTRTYGNSARFIRRSCKPNAELRHSIVKGVLHLFIVTIANCEKNVELTIKHESHDLAAIGTTLIACACGDADECTVNRSTVKKNGDASEMHKKRRGRRTTSTSLSADPEPPIKLPPKKEIEAALSSPPLPTPVPPPLPEPEEIAPPPLPEEPLQEVVKIEPEEVKEEQKDEEPIEEPKIEELPPPPAPPIELEIKEEDVKKEDIKDIKDIKEILPASPSPPARRSSTTQLKIEKDEQKDPEIKEESSPPCEKKNKKLSREERKLEAILRAIAQMERADQRKQEHQAKQAHRRESEPGPGKEEEKSEPKLKRKRRKGRARTASTNTPGNRRNRLNSTDSYMTSGDETLLSPNDNAPPSRPDFKDIDHTSLDKDAGLLLALSNGGDKANKTPPREPDSNSNSVQSSPETQLSSACRLVQAAVEPMEQNFKFPKTKKGLMNEWLNKAPEPMFSASAISPSSLTPHISTAEYEGTGGYFAPAKGLAALAHVAVHNFGDSSLHPRGSAKKRWLRQAISEDQGDSPLGGRPESPTINEAIAPPKKRRLPRESLDITPPTTPTGLVPPIINNNTERPTQEGCVEIVYSSADGDSPSQTLESDAMLEERVAEMKEEFGKCMLPRMATPPLGPETITTTMMAATLRPDNPPGACLMDPRLARADHHHLFAVGDSLIGAVEKTLSIFGFDERKPETITPTKRKLSITEYLQRKKLNNNDKSMDETIGNEENNSSESFKPSRARSNSASSCTSVTSSDEETMPLELTGKAPSAFNSEPTELERQREITSLRLKKAFGMSVDEDPKKPALDVEAILNCEITPVVTAMPPSPTFPIPGASEQIIVPPKAASPPPPLLVEACPPPALFVETNREQVAVATTAPPPPPPLLVGGAPLEGPADEEAAQRTLFYIPDEEERAPVGKAPVVYEEVEAVDYVVPPFNNPIYPNDSNFASYASVIDEDGRYEGRNPSPPPELGPASEQT